MNTDEKEFEALRLGNQLCFPLYAAAKEVVRRYKPLLDELDLTYTQYITMMVLWEKERISVSELGKCLYLDSGTLTPVLKKLEGKGYILRKRSDDDERVLMVSVTDEGMQLRVRAIKVPGEIAACINLNEEEAVFLYKILYKILDGLNIQ